MPPKAQQELAEKFIDWGLVASRCDRFPEIGRCFPVDDLRLYSDKEPFYGHYMAWRLGTWANDDLFSRLNELLYLASRLPNWRHEEHLLRSGDYSDFWSLTWQLQVAEFLSGIGSDVRWSKQGPDLSVVLDSERHFVECYVLRKSWGMLEFIRHILGLIDESIWIRYPKGLRFSLPQDKDRDCFLDQVFRPFLDEVFLSRMKKEADTAYPVLVGTYPEVGIDVMLDGGGKYQASNNAVGEPEHYLGIRLKEGVNAKALSNRLSAHHPNAVFVNYLIDRDFQVAANIRDRVPIPDPPENLDAVIFACVGIDQKMNEEDTSRAAGDQEVISRFRKR